MMESMISLGQMPRTALAVFELKKKNIPFISVCSMTTGGVTASYAMLGDFIISEPGATIGFAGRRVIQDTVKETLPENFKQLNMGKRHWSNRSCVERQYLNL